MLDWVLVDDYDNKDGRMQLPRVRRKCLFELWQKFPKSWPAPEGLERIRAVGYVHERLGRESTIYLPLYDQYLKAYHIARWCYLDEPKTNKR